MSHNVCVYTIKYIRLYLIREELKSRKLFHALQAVGLNDCDFQPHLDSLILHSVGLDDGSDETFNRYTDIMDKRSLKISMDFNQVMKQALKVYLELKQMKRELRTREAKSGA